MYDDVLLPTDGSPGSDSAVDRALDLARVCDATVHVLHVVDAAIEEHGVDIDAVEQRGRDATVRIEERANDVDVETRRTVNEGVPYRGILEYVDEHDVDVVVMGIRGLADGEESYLGSTTERVITLVDVPVLAVPFDEDGTVPESGYGTYDDVVVSTDGSDPAARAAGHAFDLAELYAADVHVVYVVDTTTYGYEDVPGSIVGLLKEGGRNAVESLATEARERDLSVQTGVMRGVPHEAIREYVDAIEADCVALGTRGRTPDTDRLLGSTTARVVRLSNTPVLLSS